MKINLIVVFAFFYPFLSWSQDGNFASIQLVNSNTTLKGSLPYGQHFNVIGSNKVPFSKEADLIWLQIFYKDRNSIDQVAFSGLWWKSEVNQSTFSIHVNKSLKFETEYRFKFSYYEENMIETEQAQKIANELFVELAFEFSEQSFDLKELESRFSEKLKTKVLSQGNTVDFGKWNDLIYRTNASMSEEYLSSFGTNINIRRAITASKKELNDLELTYSNKLKEYSDISIKSFYDTLANKIDKLNFDSTQVEKLGQFTTWDNLLASDLNILNPLRSLANAEPKKFEYFLLLYKVKREVDKHVKSIDSNNKIFEKELLTDQEILEHIKEISGRVQQVFTFGTIASTSPTTKAEVESIRLGTVYGGAVAALNFPGKIYADAFTYAGIKYFFNPVDKRLASPYLTAGGRGSILIGFLVGANSLNYKGQELDNIGGIKPILGLGWDINRYISVDVGGVFFKQQSLSELNNSSLLKVSPFVGLSLDADAFNRFKFIFSDQSYRMNTKKEE